MSQFIRTYLSIDKGVDFHFRMKKNTFSPSEVIDFSSLEMTVDTLHELSDKIIPQVIALSKLSPSHIDRDAASELERGLKKSWFGPLESLVFLSAFIISINREEPLQFEGFGEISLPSLSGTQD